MDELKHMNVKIYENYQMQAWNEGAWESGQIVRNVLFVGSDPDHQVDDLQINCCVIFLFNS